MKEDRGCAPKGGLYKTRSWLNRSSWLENCKPRAGHSMLCPYGEKYTGGENGAHFLRTNVREGGHGRQPRAGHSMVRLRSPQVLCPYEGWWRGGERAGKWR